MPVKNDNDFLEKKHERVKGIDTVDSVYIDDSVEQQHQEYTFIQDTFIRLLHRKASQVIETVRCNFSSTDVLAGIYFNGILNTVPTNRKFVFVSRTGLINKIGVTIQASMAAPACTQAGSYLQFVRNSPRRHP
mmetsp:Transcript_14650/g.35747  ORF Transcript_14650/g.35747 Transcript_14650/m.35747 type:complete len:133 (+) Transcript_14650:200-598(+)